jgi:uncharacterized membrane protein
MKKYYITKTILILLLAVMAAMILGAVFFKEAFLSLMQQPMIQKHARMMHIAAVTIFFANAVVGIIWERKSLATGNKQIVLFTYNTVTLLDSLLSSPLIILSLIGGLSLSFRLGELMQIGWLSVSFLLFLLSGLAWVITDIPTQYRVKRLIAGIRPEDQTLPAELVRIMKLRWWIGIAGVLPLVAAFILMVYKPEMIAVADWFRS